jgi:hypothetical protein
MLAGTATADPAGASVQQTSAERGDAALETVTVEARRQRELLERQLSTFVSSITIHSGNDSLARWQVPVCPLVAGLPFEQGEFVLKRVSQVASEAGIPLAPEGCDPNLLVVMTPEPEALLWKWWDRNHRLFNRDRGVGETKHKIRTDLPVRIFYNACNVAPGLAKTFELSGQPLCGTGTLGSRLDWNTVRVIYSVIAVVDLEQSKALGIGQLSDYVAMITLAQIRPQPELGAAPTILRLFHETDAARPHGLSAWDRTFLKSLYETNPANTMQISQIKTRMKEEIAR